MLLLHANSDKVTPGMRVNLIVEVYPEGAGPSAGAGKTRPPLGTLPAIPFQVLKIGR
jgi:hypothetical protein